MNAIELADRARVYARRRRNPSLIAGTHFSWHEVLNKSWYTALPAPFRLPNGNMCHPRRDAARHAKNLERLRGGVNKERKKHGLAPTGIVVFSWARSWPKNADVGGARDSQHLYFRATDHTLQEIDRLCPWSGGRADFDRIANEVFKQGGVGLYPGGNRHLDSRGYRARWSSWTR
jgi:hypothetical protein